MAEVNSEVVEPMTLERLQATFATIEANANAMAAQVKQNCAYIDKQSRQLSLALDVMISLMDDDSVEMRVRRRINFALKQIKGIQAEPS